ncbi:DinB family protein [Imtechella halotolerans]|uniref:DinB-like domain-containing protein n=1 Tax=Imtechella halotolerans K1 TaxID=946077 RepID=I0W7N1_9FLAO|nr:DinB family protein [Imtechella halotolerans]EID72397.1 hypothetical protein W5A_12856 [Imtechella halotolerans K1]WMQ64498.1 DinB family protein [Imtechella halotolerans]
MTKQELLIFNLTEIRRRSILLWEGLLPENYDWRPDPKAFKASNMIRHVLSADYGWNKIIKGEDMTAYQAPLENVPFVDLMTELELTQSFREDLLQTISNFSEEELLELNIIHPGTGQKRILYDYILRIGYHESVHAGQFLAYLRAMGQNRPFIWD